MPEVDPGGGRSRLDLQGTTCRLLALLEPPESKIDISEISPEKGIFGPIFEKVAGQFASLL